MPWNPISEAEILDKINAAWKSMSPIQQVFWEKVSIYPEKWEQHPYGDQGGGFWVVAIIGRTIIWYNDIEDGWNFSNYTRYGQFSDYHCNQTELEDVVEAFRSQLFPIKSGT